jgi:hypothetical protein
LKSRRHIAAGKELARQTRNRRGIAKINGAKPARGHATEKAIRIDDDGPLPKPGGLNGCDNAGR